MYTWPIFIVAWLAVAALLFLLVRQPLRNSSLAKSWTDHIARYSRRD